MNDFTKQSLEYIIDISNGITPKNITAESSEEDVAQAISNAASVLDIDSQEFELFAQAIHLDQYCNISILRLAKRLFNSLQGGSIDTMIEILKELTSHKIIGRTFNKSISSMCVNLILDLRILADYKEYVREVLEVISDDTIKHIAFFDKR
jgi:hypothetical protein